MAEKLRPEVRGKSLKMLERLVHLTNRSATDLVNDAVESYYKKLRDEDFALAGKAQAEFFEQHPEAAAELLAQQELSE